MRQFILLLAFLFVCGTTNAQLGVKAGANISNVTSDAKLEDLDNKIGFQVGVLYRIGIAEGLSIQPEAVYTRKGANYTFLGTKVASGMEYLDIPVVLNYKFGALPISLHVGPQFSYLMRTDVTFTNDDLGTETSVEAKKEDFEDYDFGYVVGAGIEFEQLFFELRYTQGLRKIEKETSVGDLTLETSSRHFGFQASIGWRF